MASIVLIFFEVTLQLAIGTKMENPKRLKRVQFEFENSFELYFYCSNHCTTTVEAIAEVL
jgi:hypothetical protein